MSKPPCSKLGDWVSEALAPLGVVRVRAMFGGESLSLDGIAIAIIADGKLYLKSDPAAVPLLAEDAPKPFVYTRNDQPVVMNYREAPDAALTDAGVLREAALVSRKIGQMALRSTPRRGPRTVMARGW